MVAGLRVRLQYVDNEDPRNFIKFNNCKIKQK